MRRGQTFLALVFLMGGIAALIGLTISFLATSFANTGYTYRSSVQAEAVATAGAEDALLRINRFSISSIAGTSTVSVGSSSASITITNNSPSAGFVTILSTATVANSTKKITVIAAIDSVTNQATIISWQPA